MALTATGDDLASKREHALHDAPDPARLLLRDAACVDPDPSRLERLRRTADCIVNWDELFERAEAHGLAPLLHRHLRKINALPEAPSRRVLAALVARHRQANATLTQTLIDIHTIFDQRRLPFICLKGIALAHIIYPSPALRPMRDIDLLVPADRAYEARDALTAHAFVAQDHYRGLGHGKFMQRHHHLPEVSIERDGMHVSVEIHTDAISGDSPGHLNFESLRDPPQVFRVDDVELSALNHIDMLVHLVRHALEPAAEMKLGSVCDVMTYADRFHQQLDIATLKTRYPWLANALALMHYVVELPPSLSGLRPTAATPDGAGFGPRPLSEVLREHGVGRAALLEACNPPDWWLHAYYGTKPSSPIGPTKYSRHVPKLTYWMARRLIAAMASPTVLANADANGASDRR